MDDYISEKDYDFGIPDTVSEEEAAKLGFTTWEKKIKEPILVDTKEINEHESTTNRNSTGRIQATTNKLNQP